MIFNESFIHQTKVKEIQAQKDDLDVPGASLKPSLYVMLI